MSDDPFSRFPIMIKRLVVLWVPISQNYFDRVIGDADFLSLAHKKSL